MQGLLASGSSDALDPAASAVVMARHLDEIRLLDYGADEVAGREGLIWHPGVGR